MTSSEPLREAVALKFHEAYERLAPTFGYVTRSDTREFDPASPNGQLMIAVCGEVCDAILSLISSRQSGGWQDISTLSDSLPVLVGKPTDALFYGPVSAFLDVCGNWWSYPYHPDMPLHFEPTHWQPLPDAPQGGAL